MGCKRWQAWQQEQESNSSFAARWVSYQNSSAVEVRSCQGQAWVSLSLDYERPYSDTDAVHSDLLEWQTWGGGGLGDPLTRPAETVALEVKRKLVTIEGAKKNYGVVIDPSTLEVNSTATETLRADIEKAEAGKEAPLYDRGGTVAELVARCKEETGFEPPRPQWEDEIYGPHVALPYVQEWYKKGRETGYGMWNA